MARPLIKDVNPMSKRAKGEVRPALSFLDVDRFGIIQPHDDALVIIVRI